MGDSSRFLTSHGGAQSLRDELRALRLELQTTNQKLQEYNDIIIFQANELTILRNILCGQCRRNFVESTVTPSLSSRQIGRDRSHSPNGSTRKPAKKINLASSPLSGSTSRPAKPCPTPSVRPTRAVWDASPQSSASARSRPNLNVFKPTSPRTGTSTLSKVTPKNLSRISGAPSRISPEDTASAAVIRSSNMASPSPDLQVCVSKSSISPEPTRTGTPTTAASYVQPSRPGTKAPTSPPDLLPPTLTFSRSESPETSSDHDSVSPWEVTRSPKAKQLLDVTFQHAFPHDDRINCVKFSMDGRYVAVGLSGAESNTNKWNGKAIIYSTENGMERCRLVENTNGEKQSGVNAVCFSPNGEQIAVGHKDGHISLWRINLRRVRNMFKGDQGMVTSLSFSPNGRTLLSASLDGTIRIWSVRDGSSKKTLVTTGYTDLRVALSPCGRYVAGGTGDGVLCILDFRTHQVVKRWEGHLNDVSSLVFIPNGKGLLSSSFDGTVRYWDVSSLGDTQPTSRRDTMNSVTLIRQFGGDPDHVRSIASSADGKWVLCGLDDSTARIRNISNGMHECSLHGHLRRVWSVDCSPVGNYLVMGDIDGRVSLWRMM